MPWVIQHGEVVERTLAGFTDDLYVDDDDRPHRAADVFDSQEEAIAELERRTAKG